ncbi:MAG: rRNA pseudouridine synthase [Alphaproteobacteria bacterium]|nr:rRNA pseudouridine synthase [Alphaproteobacteria bacterium]
MLDEIKTTRLAKKIAESGVASRREAERLIEAGHVKVDGVIVKTPVCFVTGENVITIDDKPISKTPDKIIVWKFHKPSGVLTTKRDTKNRKTVFDCIPKINQRLIYIGRLDYNTEGLLLFTNSGDLARKMELPSSGLKRTYRARILGTLTDEQVQKLKKGITVDGVKYGPIEVKFETPRNKQSANSWIQVTLSEGKNREIRKVMEYMSCKVNRLIRTSYGGITLGDLPRGAFVQLSDREMQEMLRRI